MRMLDRLLCANAGAALVIAGASLTLGEPLNAAWSLFIAASSWAMTYWQPSEGRNN